MGCFIDGMWCACNIRILVFPKSNKTNCCAIWDSAREGNYP